MFTQTNVRGIMNLGDFMNKIIFHIDVNNAFLSWTACEMIKNGEEDIRNIPSIIAGDKQKRSGIVLAKSEIAKKCGVKTAQTINEAQMKCKNLKIFKPDFKIYKYYSDSMYNILCEYSDSIERYSIDECFLDYTYVQLLYGNPLKTAKEIQDRMYNELGFTVNVGIGNNKLLAKMASELEKPNKINTIYSNEVKTKMWKLPVQELFMIGRRTVPELNKLNIYTIEDLAKFDKDILKNKFGKFGIQMFNFANGIDESDIAKDYIDYKGIGNSMTTNVDIKNREIAYKYLLYISECVGKRLRNEKMYTQCINVNIKDNNFQVTSHQRKLINKISNTNEIYKISKELFDEIWKGQSIRSFGIRLDKLSREEDNQISFFTQEKKTKNKKLDEIIDKTRNKFGNNTIKRAVFLNDNIEPILNNKN